MFLHFKGENYQSVHAAPWGSGFPRPGDMGTQLDTVGVPPWNIHVFRFDTGRGAGRWVLWSLKERPEVMCKKHLL